MCDNPSAVITFNLVFAPKEFFKIPCKFNRAISCVATKLVLQPVYCIACYWFSELSYS